MQATKAPNTAPEYVLGHSPEELERLIEQSAYYNHTTEEILQLAGIGPGMQVLDVGCGAGDVALLAAQLVGPKGKIVAIDQSPDALALARYRAETLGLSNITFLQENLNEYVSDGPLDAITGRLVLLYQKDPVASVRHLRQSLKPGGIFAFQEFNMAGSESWPHLPAFDRHVRIVKDTFEKAGMDPNMGTRLFFHLQDAGIQQLQAKAHTNFLVGERVLPGVKYLTQTIVSLLPFAHKLGVEIPEGFDPGQLPDQLYKACTEHKTCLTTPMMVGVWGRN